MIGLEFEWNKENNLIKEFVSSLMTSDYEWYVMENEIISNNHIFALEKKYSGENFKKIWENNFDLIYFLNVQVYLKNSKVKKIINYCDYKNSSCQLMLLISDIYYVEIYSKDSKILKPILDRKIENLEIKTEKKDNRTIMKVN